MVRSYTLIIGHRPSSRDIVARIDRMSTLSADVDSCAKIKSIKTCDSRVNMGTTSFLPWKAHTPFVFQSEVGYEHSDIMVNVNEFMKLYHRRPISLFGSY